MKAWTAWNILIIICATSNGIMDSWHWYNGDVATGWTWLFAVFFSIGVITQCLNDLFPDEECR